LDDEAIAGLALNDLDADGRRDPFGLAMQLRERGLVLYVRWGDDGAEHTGTVDEHVPFVPLDAVEPTWIGHR
jgi:hypothetical protein